MNVKDTEKLAIKYREFDRQIKEAARAARYALTLDEKLNCTKRAATLRRQKLQFRVDSFPVTA